MKQILRIIGILCWIGSIGGFWSYQSYSQELLFESQEGGIEITKEPLPSGQYYYPMRQPYHQQNLINRHLIISNNAVNIMDSQKRILVEESKHSWLDRVFLSKNAAFWGILRKKDVQDKYSELLLFDFNGDLLWKREDVPDSRVLIADDARTVVAIHEPEIEGEQYYEMTIYNATGQVVKNYTEKNEMLCITEMSPDGEYLIGMQGGTEKQWSVSINDYFIGCNNEGEQLWKTQATGLHCSRMTVANQYMTASCYGNAGLNQYVLVFNNQGTLLHQIEPSTNPRSNYIVRMASDEQHAIAFGFKNIAFLDLDIGEILWKWEAQITSEEWLIYDCVITDDLRHIIATASYAGSPIREILIFNEYGKLLFHTPCEGSIDRNDTASFDSLRLETANNIVYLSDFLTGNYYRITFNLE